MNPIFKPGNLLFSALILGVVFVVVFLIMPERKKLYPIFLSDAAIKVTVAQITGNFKEEGIKVHSFCARPVTP
jgi:hypothetical protein